MKQNKIQDSQQTLKETEEQYQEDNNLKEEENNIENDLFNFLDTYYPETIEDIGDEIETMSISTQYTGVNLMNAGETSSATSRPRYNVQYPESTMRTQESSGIPPRTAVELYTNNNPLVRTTGRRRPPEVTFFGKDSVLLNITECDPQLNDTYLEQWTASVKRDYAQKHEIEVEIGEQMIRIAENYLGETAKAAWEAFKTKFPEEVQKIAEQGNNIFNFCFAIHRLLTARDANTGLNIRQQEAMRDLE
ncbi:hypothetical protein PanWU01x14_095650 [Parasponia andersonii]|uniref:Uncharacterized protein n=1 Tax=Parasponia andersonii TaxID=3476 RepID=A0A2P5D529_PARAD|nr:hypothetical protein PanWU01x14_095650 [Parasponia andersonii]